jgi:hypothetical protein
VGRVGSWEVESWRRDLCGLEMEFIIIRWSAFLEVWSLDFSS